MESRASSLSHAPVNHVADQALRDAFKYRNLNAVSRALKEGANPNCLYDLNKLEYGSVFAQAAFDDNYEMLLLLIEYADPIELPEPKYRYAGLAYAACELIKRNVDRIISSPEGLNIDALIVKLNQLSKCLEDDEFKKLREKIREHMIEIIESKRERLKYVKYTALTVPLQALKALRDDLNMIKPTVKRPQTKTVMIKLTNFVDELTERISIGPSKSLYSAAGRGNLAEMTAELQAGADINYRDDDFFTPLMSATMRGHVEAAKKLLDAGATTTWSQFFTRLFYNHRQYRPNAYGVLYQLVLGDIDALVATSGGQDTSYWITRINTNFDPIKNTMADGERRRKIREKLVSVLKQKQSTASLEDEHQLLRLLEKVLTDLTFIQGKGSINGMKVSKHELLLLQTTLERKINPSIREDQRVSQSRHTQFGVNRQRVFGATEDDIFELNGFDKVPVVSSRK